VISNPDPNILTDVAQPGATPEYLVDRTDEADTTTTPTITTPSGDVADTSGTTPENVVASDASTADTVMTDDAAAHTAIWFHGMQTPNCADNAHAFCGCTQLKRYIHYPNRADVITPISSTDDGGAQGTSAAGHGLCHLWGPSEEPWSHPAPTTAELTVSGYSLGRIPFFKFIQNHGFATTANGDANPNYFPNLKRAVLMDPSYEAETYTATGGTPKKGLQVVAEWLQADPSHIFVFAYGGATMSLGINNWKTLFIDSPQFESLRQQIFVVNNRHLLHYQIPDNYYSCLFDNTCGGLANHDYSATTYRN